MYSNAFLFYLAFYLRPFVGYLYAEWQSFCDFLHSSCLLHSLRAAEHRYVCTCTQTQSAVKSLSDYTYTITNPKCALCWHASRPSGDRLLHICALSLSVCLSICLSPRCLRTWQCRMRQWESFSQEKLLRSRKLHRKSPFALCIVSEKQLRYMIFDILSYRPVM